MKKAFKLTLAGHHSEDERGVAAIKNRIASFQRELHTMGVELESGSVEFEKPAKKAETKTEAATPPANSEPVVVTAEPAEPKPAPKNAPAKKRPAANRKK